MNGISDERQPRSPGEPRLLLTPLANGGGTAWGGIGMHHFFISSGFQARPPSPAMVLFLHLRGSPQVSWRSGRQRFRRQWKYGDYAFVGRDADIRDVCVDGDHAGLAIDMPSGESQPGMAPSFPACPPLGTLPPHLYGADPHLLNMALSIRDEIQRGCPCGPLFAESISLALLSHFYGNHRHAEPRTRKGGHGFPAATLKLVDDYIHANLGRNLTLAELAGVARVGIGQFCRRFGKATGMPPHRYLLHARIDRAKTMLAAPCRSVTDVALELGFASTSHFSFTFRKLTGISPSAFLQLV